MHEHPAPPVATAVTIAIAVVLGIAGMGMVVLFAIFEGNLEVPPPQPATEQDLLDHRYYVETKTQFESLQIIGIAAILLGILLAAAAPRLGDRWSPRS